MHKHKKHNNVSSSLVFFISKHNNITWQQYFSCVEKTRWATVIVNIYVILLSGPQITV